MEQHKRDKYHELLPEDPSTKICVFKAPVFEAHGRWCDDARFMFKYLIDRAHEKTGEPKSVLSTSWRSRLVFAHHPQGSRSRIPGQIGSACHERPVCQPSFEEQGLG
jgi:hypothetical protein